MHSLHPSASDIQTHLYNSFLQASTYDVSLKVSGTWNAIYKLHRVVLIQSGFFRSLFTAGFSESTVRHTSLRNGTDEITVTFDDFNITRAAFEVCISRLYGGGPALYVLPGLMPTTNSPFIPSTSSDGGGIPQGSHPATPRFLLSLLTTSIYLSIPSVASQALSLILKTIGITTVVRYLDFACGKSIDNRTELTPNEPESAVGLENVAQLLDDEISTDTQEPYVQSDLGTDDYTEVDRKEEGINASRIIIESNDSESGYAESIHDMHHYGPVSDKIGEACVCWLTRWAINILQLETHEEFPLPSSQHDTRSRSKSLSSFDPQTTLSAIFASQLKVNHLPVIFGPGGLSAKWVSAIVGSDTLFVKDERQRYSFARSVVELRRREGIQEDEEKIWTTMFEQGIYYNNMTFEDIVFISQDLSLTTNRPYVSQSVLHASHWTQSILRHQIMQRSNMSSSSPIAGASPSSVRDKELGITLTTADILLKISNEIRGGQMNTERRKIYYPVLGDSSLRIGENGTITSSTTNGTQMTMEDFFNVSQAPNSKHPRPVDQITSNHISTTENAFFGIIASRFSAQACVESDPTAKSRWTPFSPYRFSVEFWDVDLLKEKSRLHSQTIWHAGNLFNVYVQLVRKKGQAQLGIYLHRQSSVDPIPASSAPSTLSKNQNGAKHGTLLGISERQGHLRQPSLPSLLSIAQQAPSSSHYSPSIHPPARSTTPSANSNYARSASPHSSPSSSPSPSPLAFNIPSTLSTSAPQQPYRDPRPSVSAYFAISCASATGTSQTRFSSSPDVFSISQSWGWKSSTLRTEDFVEIGTQVVSSAVSRGEEVSLRATVIMGLV